MNHSMRDYVSIFVIIFTAVLIATAGSQYGFTFNGYPILFICMVTSFIIHWLLFIPSYIAKTEKFFDISGTVAYVVVLGVSAYFTNQASGGDLGLRSIITIILILVWALRLGIFLFVRVLKAGEDRRFRDVKKNFSKFLVWWTLSALWVFLTTVNALTMIINNANYHDDIYCYFGMLLWIIGFLIELTADEQKRKFKSKPENKDRFINIGLWSISRHPNYFGEILLWVGMAVITLPTLKGWQYVTLISPIFIYFLLTRMSGVNLLEDYAEKKWGGSDDYEDYKSKTPTLVPFFKSW